MDITKEAAQALLEIGTMAAWRGETADAKAILGGLEAVRPNSAAPLIARAVACMNEGRYEPAIQTLEEALAIDNGCDIARFFLALACRQSGYSSRCQGVCEQIVSANSDENAVELAGMLQAVPAGA